MSILLCFCEHDNKLILQYTISIVGVALQDNKHNICYFRKCFLLFAKLIALYYTVLFSLLWVK